MSNPKKEQYMILEISSLKQIDYFRIVISAIFLLISLEVLSDYFEMHSINYKAAGIITGSYFIYSVSICGLRQLFQRLPKEVEFIIQLFDLFASMALPYLVFQDQWAWIVFPGILVIFDSLFTKKPGLEYILPAFASILLWIIPALFSTERVEITTTTKFLNSLIYFAIAIIGVRFAQNYDKSLLINKKQQLEIQWLAKINAMVIEEMQYGIVAFDKNYKTILLNDFAKQIIKTGRREHLPEKLIKNIIAFKSEKQGVLNLFGEEIFINIIHPNKNIKLLFIEKQNALVAKSQQTHLANMGQLSATVAHELRNPMSAIYSASQLLMESPELEEQDYDLAEIISKQIERANNIIEEILLMSKHQEAAQTQFELLGYLKALIQEFCEQENIEADSIKGLNFDRKTTINFDLNMFRQIVWNLISNAFKHGDVNSIEIEVTELAKDVFIDFKNVGSPFEPAIEEGLFTPFYTTHNQGTGLGLYICRKMCNANKAKLTYLHQDFHHVFRIQILK